VHMLSDEFEPGDLKPVAVRGYFITVLWAARSTLHGRTAWMGKVAQNRPLQAKRIRSRSGLGLGDRKH
jgi:hypothetical protein